MAVQTVLNAAGSWKKLLSRLTLAQRFAMAGSVVMLCGMIAMGSWVSNRIEVGVVHNTAIATALYMESVIAPLSQELQRSDTLSEGAARALTELFSQTQLGKRVLRFKIWKRDGLVAFSSKPEQIGKRFSISSRQEKAWGGQVVARFVQHRDNDDRAEGRLVPPFLEIYSPIRKIWSGKVIAIAEFYENGEKLQQDLAASRRTTWLIVAAIMAAMAALLFGIVLGGSRTIIRQQGALRARIDELSELAEQNRALRLRVQRASNRAAALNERYLRRIGADLHDGPAQLLALASLRLDRLARGRDATERAAEAAAIHDSLNQAMRDIRGICRGLALPEIEEMPLGAVVRRAVEAHRANSGTKVDLSISGDIPEALDHSEKICAYRFVQEGLSNAFRHGGGLGQRVALTADSATITLTVSDSGPGLVDRPSEPEETSGLGLAGLQERVESLGGTFYSSFPPGGGARITMILPRHGER